MWCRSIRSRLAVLGSALLAVCSLASSAAHAQQRDDAWVIAQVMAGKFEELRSLEKLSDEGVPFAMYWWGTLMHFCILDRCDQQRASELFLGAAKAGHGRAQVLVFALAAKLPAEVAADVTAGVAVPKDGYARQIHAIQSVAGPSSRVDPKARAAFVALATSERQLGLLAELVKQEGMLKRADELRAVADSGHVEASELVRKREIILRTSDAQVIERARAGELWLAAAHCDTAATERGKPILEPDTLSICERAAAQGFPGAVRALLRHHHHRKNQRAAEYFAGVCDGLLGLACAEDIAAYYDDRRGESADRMAKWELWDLADKVMDTTGASEADFRGKNEGTRRRLLALVVRTGLINEACLMQRLDVTTGAREANPQCPWRTPIAIPAEFLSAAR
jgi:hypothetical protein